MLFKHLSFAKTFQNLVIAASFLSTSIGVLAVGQTTAAVSRQLLYRMDLSSGQIVSSTCAWIAVARCNHGRVDPRGKVVVGWCD